MKLQGAKAVITGASRGIGCAIAKRLIEADVRCFLVGRSPQHMVDAFELPEARQPTDWPRIIKADVADKQTWTQAGVWKPTEGKIDILVNAAGVGQGSLLQFTKAEDVDEIMETNFMGTLWACRKFARQLQFKSRKGRAEDEQHDRDLGVIVNVASLLGEKGGRGSAVYAASKAAVLGMCVSETSARHGARRTECLTVPGIGLTRALATELTPAGVRVNALVPGYIDTSMTARKFGSSFGWRSRRRAVLASSRMAKWSG